MHLEHIQQALRDEKLDGWLFYDFRKSNPVAYQVLSLPFDAFYTRRWFYFIPAQGSPTALVSAVEAHVLGELPGNRVIFRTWQEIQTHLQSILLAGTRIAMEYSPMNAIPYMSRVDAGTLELVRSCGVEVVEGSPHVAINANASNPHYEPTSAQHSPIGHGDLVLFDFWARLPEPHSIIADYTWMAFAGTRDEIPARQREVFEIVRRARDTGIAFARKQLAAGERVEGWQVDDATRAVIAGAGYGEYFIHRTGHSIGTVIHADGANMDNLETRDERVLLPSTCCSIEPGIYLPEFGIRSEVDILVHEHDVEVTGVPVQEEIVALL